MTFLSSSFPELCKSHTGRHRWSAGGRFPEHLGADCNSLQSKSTALVIRMWELSSVFARTGNEEESDQKRTVTILTLTKKKKKKLHAWYNDMFYKNNHKSVGYFSTRSTTSLLFHFHSCLYQVFSERQPALCIGLSGGRSLLVAPVLSPRPSYPDTPLLPDSFSLPAFPCDDDAALCPSVDPSNGSEWWQTL